MIIHWWICWKTVFQQFNKRTAYISDNQTLTYKQLDLQSKIVATYLQSQGLTIGERVGVMLPNLLHYPVIACGIIRAGLTLVNINPTYTHRELVHQLADSSIKFLFYWINCKIILPKNWIIYPVCNK